MAELAVTVPARIEATFILTSVLGIDEVDFTFECACNRFIGTPH